VLADTHKTLVDLINGVNRPWNSPRFQTTIKPVAPGVGDSSWDRDRIFLTEPGGAMQEGGARIVEQILVGLPEQDRQALVRFYVHGEPADVVCREVGLSEEQFRRIRTQAKQRFLALARGGTRS
jgi:hypothetical protein